MKSRIPINDTRDIYPDLPQCSVLNDKHLNADITINLRVSNGNLETFLVGMRVKDGKETKMLSRVMEKIKGRDLLKDDRIGGQLKGQFKQLCDMKVVNGKIILMGAGGTVKEMMNSRK